eukprot:4815363-Prymnesium_polylepis.1
MPCTGMPSAWPRALVSLRSSAMPARLAVRNKNFMVISQSPNPWYNSISTHMETHRPMEGTSVPRRPWS